MVSPGLAHRNSENLVALFLRFRLRRLPGGHVILARGHLDGPVAGEQPAAARLSQAKVAAVSPGHAAATGGPAAWPLTIQPRVLRAARADPVALV